MSRFSWQKKEATSDNKDNNKKDNESESDNISIHNLGNAKRFSWQKDDVEELTDNNVASDVVNNLTSNNEKSAESEKPKINSNTIVKKKEKKEDKPNQNNWRILAGRQQGTSHVSDNNPCEDYYSAKSIGDEVIIFVADGAGSAKHGGNGAKLACESAMNLVQSTLTNNILTNSIAKNGAYDIAHDIANNIVNHIQKEITRHIEQLNVTENNSNNNEPPLTLRDFACTFLGVMVIDGQTLCMQVGDGAIVINCEKDSVDSGLHTPIKPMQGEYANMTHFVTDIKANEYLETQTYQKPPTQIAVMTDGLQRLALNLADFSPHLAFFAPFFNALLTTENDDSGKQALQTALDNFLDSKSVNARTDDDKTLVLVQVS